MRLEFKGRGLIARRMAVLAVAALIVCVRPVAFAAQTADPFSVHVESNLVLVYVEVSKKAAIKLSYHPTPEVLRCGKAAIDAFNSLPLSEPYLPGECDDWFINDLTAADFHVFEDGVEQKVQNVILEARTDMTVRDNLGVHDEWSNTPQGKWSTADVPGDPDQTMHFYSVGYVPSTIGAGKCHRIEVKVDRPDAVVFAPKRYCFVPHPATDPLRGTDLGERLLTKLSSHEKPQIPLFVQANFVYPKPNVARVDVVIDFPWDRLRYRCNDAGDLEATVGVLGVIYTDEHTVAGRFSDSAFGGIEIGPHAVLNSAYLDCDNNAPARLPSRYETQIDLSPGQYELRVALTDGKKFGRATVPLKIDSYGTEQLALSSVMLLKRFRPAEAAAQEAAAVNLAPKYVPLVSEDKQITPTANATFSPEELVPVYFEVYDPSLAKRTATKVQAHVRIVSMKTGAVKQFGWFDAAEFRRAGTTTFAIAKAFPVSDLPKGKYLIEAQASDSAGHTTPWRSTEFTLK